jgi:beta-1,4-mannosyl-glycoprotein beta-1,4-N-acetylglucosaminyltransferase
MIYDVFYFLRELDLLEIRLNILDPYVDKFILIESDETFFGTEKPLFYKLNEERYSKWKHKIIHCVVKGYFDDEEIYQMAVNSPNTNYGDPEWIQEFYMKEYARRALKDCKDDDIIFISDLDEIWNPLKEFRPVGNEVIKPRQLPYIYFLNQRTDTDWTDWTGTTCCRYETIKNGIINHIRTDSLQKYTVIENGGWHFNSIGGREPKIKAWDNIGYDTFRPEVWARRELNSRIDETSLPEYIKSNKLRYEQYFK